MVRERKASAGKMRVQLRVSFDVPIGCDRDDCQQYVLEAVKFYCNHDYHKAAMRELDNVVVRRATGRTNTLGTVKVLE